jgi:hypothetical protein
MGRVIGLLVVALVIYFGILEMQDPGTTEMFFRETLNKIFGEE